MAESASAFMRNPQFVPVAMRRRWFPRAGAGFALLFLFMVLAVLIFEWVMNTSAYSMNTKLMASVVVLLGAMPTFFYLYHARFDSIPFFEGHCLFYALSYGYAGFRPIIAGGRLADVAEPELMLALKAAILCLVMLEAGFYFVGHLFFAGVRPFTLKIEDHPRTTPLMVITGFAATFFLGALGMLGMGFLAQVSVAVWSFTIILYGTCVYAGYLPRWAVIVFWALFVPWMLVVGSGLLDGGQIGGIVAYAIWQVICTLWARGRPSLVWLVLAVVAVLLLQPIKGVYRTFIWGSTGYSRADQVQVLSDMLMESGRSYQKSEESMRMLLEGSFARMNHLIVTAGVIRDTGPYGEPFVKGETYYPLLVKWIPRMVWPNKPIEDLGNRWARRYGYLGSTDFNTSFNLPWLTEMYMNFGWWGVVVVPLLLGIFFRGIWAKFARRPQSVLDFAFSMSILSSLIVVESHLSMKLGGVIVHSIALFIVIGILRYYFRFLNLQSRVQSANPDV